ncbi:MAG: class I SAM-dependent methyltransferase [Bryobacteraceae bacterium]
MDVTNRFVLDWARRRGGRVLDYGCGGGELVAAGRAAGLEIFGAEVFYAGSNARQEAANRGLLGDAVREIGECGSIPFPDEHFDLVTSNQVMEHVDDLDAVLREIHRVLKPGGSVLSVFPSADVWREGHIGIPFSHWFRKGSRLRFHYTWALRAAGLGTWKDQAPNARQWAINKLDWIDAYTRYRTRTEILAAYRRYFFSELCERDYIRYRLLDRPGGVRRALARVALAPGIGAAAVALFRKLAFLVIVSRKR